MFGGKESLVDGSEVLVDADYLIESIIDPAAKIVAGYPPVMVAYQFSDEQLQSLVAYIESLSSESSEPLNKQPAEE